MSNFDLTRISIAAVLLMCPFLGSSSTYGQQSTEQFIPIGYSPGVSNKYTYIGSIVAVDREAHTIVVQSNRGKRTIRVTPRTRIWLDRSKIKRTNLVGSYSDCEEGRKVEIMHDRDDENVADWIKIESK